MPSPSRGEGTAIHASPAVTGSSGRCALRVRVAAGQDALAQAARETVQAEAARRLAAAVEAGDHRAAHVHDLAARIDAQAGAAVVQNFRRGQPPNFVLSQKTSR